jgi:hypothetical protein
MLPAVAEDAHRPGGSVSAWIELYELAHMHCVGHIISAVAAYELNRGTNERQRSGTFSSRSDRAPSIGDWSKIPRCLAVQDTLVSRTASLPPSAAPPRLSLSRDGSRSFANAIRPPPHFQGAGVRGADNRGDAQRLWRRLRCVHMLGRQRFALAGGAECRLGGRRGSVVGAAWRRLHSMVILVTRSELQH